MILAMKNTIDINISSVEIEYCHVKSNKLSGNTFKEVESKALLTFKEIKAKTKRTPYIRSKYYKNEKIFLNIFWSHLYQKHEKDRIRRLKFFNCAIELIQSTSKKPTTKPNPNKKNELLHRFGGKTKENQLFLIQIKENRSTKRKDLISIIPK